eukprot:gene20067-22809_t
MIKKTVAALLMSLSAAAMALPLGSQSVLVVEDDTGKILVEKNANAVVPIASLTKLMTAMVTPGVVEVSIGKPIPSEGREPKELMDEVQAWIESEMRRLDPEAYPATS